MTEATLAGWLTKSVVAKDEAMKTPDIIFDINLETKIEILNSEKSPRFMVTDAKGQTVTLESKTPNEMMSWVLALRACTFQDKKLSMSNFRILSVIGRGFYGKVMLVADNKTEQLYAIKSIQKSKLAENDKVHTVISERNILTKVDHPFIVSLKFAFQSPSKFYFGLEYAPGGELFYHMQKRNVFPLDQVKLYVAQIALALHHLHEHGIVYRDLKPENILLDREGFIKLTDFGLSKDVQSAEMITTTFCGTVEYLAPEVVRHQPYGVPVDWWTLGILTYELLFGRTPFVNQNRIRLFHDICKRPVQYPPDADRDAVCFIDMLLTKDPKKRPGWNEIRASALFRDMNWDDVLSKKIRPTFVPEVKSAEVPQNVDREFTEEQATDSLAMPVFGSLAQVPGFSYADSDEAAIKSDDDENKGSDTPLSPTKWDSLTQE